MYLRVLVASCFVLLGSVTSVEAAVLRTQPQSASVSVGSSITVAVVVASTDQALNAVSGTLEFSEDLLSVTSVSKGGSVIGLWVQEPSFSNAMGTVNFEGIVLNPGYQGANGTVVNVTFRALKAGTASISIGAGSVLANDGNGTEILTAKSGSVITVTPPVPKAVPEMPETPKPAVPKPVEATSTLRIDAAPAPSETDAMRTPAPPVVAGSVPVPDSRMEKLWHVANYLTLALVAVVILGSIVMSIVYLVRALVHPAPPRLDAAHELHDARGAMTRALKRLKKLRRERLLSSEEMLVMQSLESSLKVLTGIDGSHDD